MLLSGPHSMSDISTTKCLWLLITLHDIKGHMSNVFAELKHKAAGTPAQEIEKIKQTTLAKGTLRCVDYRKATILLCEAMNRTSKDYNLIQLASTAAEISEILYATNDKRSPRTILRLYNHSLTECCVQKCIVSPSRCYAQKCLGSTSMHSCATAPHSLGLSA